MDSSSILCAENWRAKDESDRLGVVSSVAKLVGLREDKDPRTVVKEHTGEQGR